MNQVNKTKNELKIYYFLQFLRVQPPPKKRPLRQNIMVFCPEHPKRDQTLKFTPLSETTSIPVPFLWESPPLQEWKVHIFVLSTQSCNVFQASHDFTNLTLWRVYFWVLTPSQKVTRQNIAASVAPSTPPPPPGRARRFVSYESYSCRSRGGAGPSPLPLPPPLIFKSNWGPSKRETRVFWKVRCIKTLPPQKKW